MRLCYTPSRLDLGHAGLHTFLKCLYAYCHLPSIKDTCKKLQLYTYTFAYVGLFSFKQILQYVHPDWSSGGGVRIKDFFDRIGN